MNWQLQYAEELKKEVEYHRNRCMHYFRLMTHCESPEVRKEIDTLCNPFNPEKTPETRYEYKVGDVLMKRWDFTIARIIKIEGDWYYFDRKGMDSISECSNQVHKNSVEPEYCMRKVNIDLPLVTFKEEVEV